VLIEAVMPHANGANSPSSATLRTSSQENARPFMAT
jgi:hypothetical protein